MIAKSHLTAIARKSLPVPVRWLLRQGNAIQGHVLDFGCGKCKAINDRTIAQLPCVNTMTSYDPYYETVFGLDAMRFDTILCTYVICALPPEEELPILKRIQSMLAQDGMAYISVRNDKPKNGHGYSSRGTFQRWVELPYLRQLHKCSQSRIFLLTPASNLP